MTSLWCVCYLLWTDVTHCFGVSIVDFEQVNASCVYGNGPISEICQ